MREIQLDEDGLCPHQGDPHSCPPCQREKGVIKVETSFENRGVTVFAAKFDGYCRGCALPISAGQPVYMADEGDCRHTGC